MQHLLVREEEPIPVPKDASRKPGNVFCLFVSNVETARIYSGLAMGAWAVAALYAWLARLHSASSHALLLIRSIAERKVVRCY